MKEAEELDFLADQIAIMREMDARTIGRLELEIEQFLKERKRYNERPKENRGLRHHYRSGRVQGRD